MDNLAPHTESVNRDLLPSVLKGASNESDRHRITSPDPAHDQVANSFPPLKGGSRLGMNFRPATAAELLAEEPQPLRWLWDRFLAEGCLALLAAFMKVGKSTFVYALAVAVAQGRPFLGFATQRAGVLILAVEEHPRDVRLRLERFGMQSGDPIHIHRGPLANSGRTLAELDRYIRRHEIKLVIVDTLARFWTVIEENDNAEIERQVSPLLDLAHESGAVVLLVHHEGKKGGERGRGIRGGSALLALVDQAFSLTQPRGPAAPERVLEAVGRYAEYTPSPVTIRFDGETYTVVGTPETPRREAAKVSVWEALSDIPLTISALAEAGACSDNAVTQALQDLGDQVVREGKGVKGQPYTFRRAPMDSIPANSPPIGEETNPNPAERTPRSTPAMGRFTGNGSRPGRQLPVDFNSIPDRVPGPWRP